MSRLFDIDSELLQRHIDELGEIGCDDETGLFRPIYSPPWLQARGVLEGWMREAGLSTRVDEAGNLFGRLAGTLKSSVVLSGSHLDTVRNGGKYDGALGIHAAISAVSAIAATGETPRRPIEVVALCEEEGSRYTSPMWGTQAMLGMIANDTPDNLFDEQLTSMSDAMESVGLDAGLLPNAVRSDIGNFVELHIEQGAILESEGVAMGIVEAITGQRQLVITVNGKQNHAGTTPMDLRTDALSGTAEIILQIEQIARRRGRPAVATVGRVEVLPGSRNVIPGTVSFTVDIRNPVASEIDSLTDEIRRTTQSVALARGLTYEIEEVSLHAPVMMDFTVRDVISKAAAANGILSKLMPSGAGHDSQLFAERVPTAMIFTPSIGGISHSPLEFTPIEMITPCVSVLATTLWTLANQEQADLFLMSDATAE